MTRLSPSDITVRRLRAVGSNLRLGTIGVMLVGSMAACSDDKGPCSDADLTGDPVAPYDLGTGADATDFGLSDTDTGTGDPIGRGRNCADFD